MKTKYRNDSGGFSSDFPEKKRQNKYPFIIVLLLIKLDVIVAALIALVGYFSHQDVHYNLPLLEKEEITELSVYCNDISLGPDDDDETFNTKATDLSVYTNTDGRYLCKYKRDNMKEAVQNMVARISRLRTAKGLDNRPYLSCGNKSLAAKSGHLTFTFSGMSQHQKYKGKGDDLKLHWNKHPTMSYIDPVIHYHNGEITIPEGRTYFIYASIHFNISRGGNSGYSHRPRQFILRICRNNRGYEQTLLGKAKLLNASNGEAVSSLNLGSYLQMSRNDKIYVKVSDADSIIRDSRSNTFGMFPLST